jgi:hypothetical protein
MAGLIVIGVVVAYVAIFWFVIAKARNRGERISAIVIALLIPFWDLPIGYLNFYQHCSQEGGIYIDKEFRAPDSILIGESSAYRPDTVLKLGFKTVEFKDREDIIRFTAGVDKVAKSIHTTPISLLKIEYSGHKLLPWNLVRTEQIVTRLKDGKVVAKQTDFSWRGMWWEVSTRVHVISPTQCYGVREKSLLASLREAK